MNSSLRLIESPAKATRVASLVVSGAMLVPTPSVWVVLSTMVNITSSLGIEFTHCLVSITVTGLRAFVNVQVIGVAGRMPGTRNEPPVLLVGLGLMPLSHV